MSNFIETFKEKRLQAGLSQQKLANLINVDRTLISQWERGICEPNIETLRKICIVLDISADELLEIETEEERKKIIINNSFNNNTGKQNIKF